MTGQNGTVERDDLYYEGLPDTIMLPPPRGLTVDQAIDTLQHGPDADRFRLFFEHGPQEAKRYATAEAADVAFTKLILSAVGGDFDVIDWVVRRSEMISHDWLYGQVGEGLYWKRIVLLAAVELWREYQANPEHARLATETAEDVFAAATQTVQDFMRSAPVNVPWLVKDLVAVGGKTSLSARVKLGKTEFAMHLAVSVACGQSIFGKEVTKAKVLYLTEQADSVREAIRRVGGQENQDMWITPWHKVHKLSWPEIVAQAVGFCQSHDIKLLVVDTLSRFARIKDENDSAEAMRVMEPLHAAMATTKLAMLIVRHDRKSGGDVSDSGRGSSAYNGEVDILLGLRKVQGKRTPRDDDHEDGDDDDEPVGKDRRRLLVAESRYGNDSEDLLLVLTADNEYRVLGQPHKVKVEDEKQALLKCIPLGKDQARKWNEVQQESGLSRRRARDLRDWMEENAVVNVDTERPGGAVLVWQPKPAQLGQETGDGGD